MGKKKRVIILGATGSIGQTVLREIHQHQDQFEVVAISCCENTALTESIIKQFKVSAAAVVGAKKINADCKLFFGVDGLTQMITECEFDILVVAISGINGLKPTLCAIERGKSIILASKEILVAAGSLVTKRASENNVKILPLDSEHNAIFQCLKGENKYIKKIQLTASGGKFWNQPLSIIKNAKVSDVLSHPKWSMGRKITVDSSTMANKGLEIIEAMHLFNLHANQIEVLIHPDCIVHSLVAFQDGNFLAQLSLPSMRYAARYCLFFPERCDIKDELSLDLANLQQLHFYQPDFVKFPCLRLAYQVASMKSSMHIAYNAANEVAANYFLLEKISFTDIAKIIEQTLQNTENKNYSTLEEILNCDQIVRQKAEEITKRIIS